MKKLKIGDLEKIKEKVRRTANLRQGKAKAKIIVHMGTCGIAAGAREILTALLKALEKQKIKDVMSHPLVTIDPNSNIEEAAILMSQRGLKRLPVIEKNKIVGIITSSDIMRASPTLIRILSNILKR